MQTTANKQDDLTSSPVIQFDSDGYLIDQHRWSKTIACMLANNEGITQLTENHWQLIYYIRDYFNRLNAMPLPRRICRQIGIEGHNINSLFGSCLAAWRIAGLPNPGDEARAHSH